jgi:circadian clock protein KaiC
VLRLSGDRVSTGIEGFDTLIEGGIQRGDLILLAGPPGSGKTIFASQYLYHGISKKDERGLYVSFAENREAFLRNMKRLGMDFERYEREGKFRFLDLFLVKEKDVSSILSAIEEEVDSLKAQRLVIDSFSAFALAFTEKIDVRIVLHTLFGKIARRSGVTTLLVSEGTGNVESVGDTTEGFVVDGLVCMNMLSEKGYLGRKLQIIKMRGTKTSKAQLRYDIRENGIRIYPEPEIEHAAKATQEKIHTGVEGLDNMLNGGLINGSATAIGGASGTGKTTMTLQFIDEGVRHNERSLFISFEEPVEQLIQSGEGFGWNLKGFEEKGVLRIVNLYPEPHNFEEQLMQIDGLLLEHRPVRFVIDSLTPLRRAMSDDEYVMRVKCLVSHLKAKGTTSMFTLVGDVGAFAQEHTGISTVLDNIVALRYVELESALRRSLVIYKVRASGYDADIREFVITPKGIVVKEKFKGVDQVLGAARMSLPEEAVRAWSEVFKEKRA